MRKAAIYCRVSSTEQANKDSSIPTQKKMLHKYAEDNNINIVKEYIDAGFSAYKDIESRKNFLQMIADAKTKPKPFDVILYCYNDRVFRNMEDAVLYRSILRKKCNVELICITQPFDVNTPQGKLMERFMDALAEFDSASKGERVKAVMINEAEKGVVLGEPPYGYAINEETGKLAPYEPESAVVRYIFDEYINGGSLRSIGVDLRKNGASMFGEAALVKVSKAVHNKGKYKTHKISWQPKYISKLLRNKTYTGEYEWDGKIIENNHPKIISKETYELANIILDKKSTVRRDSKDYLLKDLIFCYECGGSLSQLCRTYITKSGETKVYRKLRCSNHVRLYNCYYNFNDMQEIENLLFSELQKIKTEKIKYENLNIIETNDNIIKINQMKKKLAGFDEQFDRQMEAYQAGVINLSQLQKYKEKLEEEKQSLSKEIQAAQNQQQDKEYNKSLFYDKLNNTLSSLFDENIDLQTKKNALKLLIESIHISKKKDLMIVTFRN